MSPLPRRVMPVQHKPPRYYEAKTLGELKVVLETLIVEFGPDMGWNGWDDESLIIQTPDNKDAVFVHPGGMYKNSVNAKEKEKPCPY